MDNVFEKVTLYDVLGYGFPGVYLLTILFLEVYKFIPSTLLCIIKGHDGIVIIGLIVLSYVTGITLSEISKVSIISNKLFKDDGIKNIPPDTEIETGFLKYIDEAALKKALKKDQAEDKVYKKDLDYIYSVIQADNDYKRIHNYASAEVMSRNLAMANIMGCLFIVIVLGLKFFNKLGKGNLFVFEIFGALLFAGISYLMARRSKNFARKKVFYSVNWFISMSSKPKKENREAGGNE